MIEPVRERFSVHHVYAIFRAELDDNPSDSDWRASPPGQGTENVCRVGIRLEPVEHPSTIPSRELGINGNERRL